MASVSTSLLVMLVLMAGCRSDSAEASRSREKYLEFAFSTYDRLLLPNATAFFVVPPLAGLPGPNSTSLFGGVVVFDDLITVGPDPNSQAIGRAKGLYVWDNKEDSAPGFELIVTAVFNNASGFPDGSSLSYRGFASVNNPVRENAIVGGTGLFRLARGWAESSIFDSSQGTINIPHVTSGFTLTV